MFKLNRSFFWFSQLKKDFLVDYSYKITFFSQFFGIFLTAASFFFISEIFVNTKSDHLKAFNYDYFIFATIGIAILDIVITIMRSLTQSLREAQSFGYVEILFISKIKPGYIFLCAAIYPFLKGVIKFILYLLLIQTLSNHSFLFSSIMISFFLFLVMLIPFLALSYLSVSFVLYFKQSDPINFFINIILSVFSGIIYPVTVLPLFMQNIANYIPLTKQLNSTRQVLINNFLDPYIYSHLFFMHLFLSIFFLLLCFSVFQISIYAVKKNGTIGTY
jgi:ABC-2 type transport system permease protein